MVVYVVSHRHNFGRHLVCSTLELAKERLKKLILGGRIERNDHWVTWKWGKDIQGCITFSSHIEIPEGRIEERVLELPTEMLIYFKAIEQLVNGDPMIRDLFTDLIGA